MKIDTLQDWGLGFEKPLMIAGPCSAESEEQLLDTCVQLKDIGINVARAGIWKPRTRPNNFEGIGLKNMKSRINSIKGVFNINSTIDDGLYN